ncbi:MAG: sporulation peptidase YabG [Bacillota bacterium]
MNTLKIGDHVTRKSYGGDIQFEITDIITRSNGRRIYILRGMLYRIIADSDENDLEWKNPQEVRSEIKNKTMTRGMHNMSQGFSLIRNFLRVRGKPGTILHIDSSADFLEMCRNYYDDARIKSYGHVIPESEQPANIQPLLSRTKADILIVTGHDGFKKNQSKINTLDSYRNSKYFIQSVQEARKYEKSYDKLCIFAGACQSFYEGIIEAGANFASSPGRILIHALDPAKVGDRIALTDSRVYVTQEQIAKLTQSGLKGIGGIRSRGHYNVTSRHNAVRV